MSVTVPKVTYSVGRSGLADRPWTVIKKVRGDSSCYKLGSFKFKGDAERAADKLRAYLQQLKGGKP